MSRRQFVLKGCMTVLVGLLPATGKTSGITGLIKDGGVEFRWEHATEGLQCVLVAPTAGWIAVGFNAEHRLLGTRFLMAVTSEPVLRWQERVARVPPGENIQSLGVPAAFRVNAGEFRAGRSEISLTVARRISSEPKVDLSAGTRPYLMLAWSNEADFDHHSAWRKHYAINL